LVVGGVTERGKKHFLAIEDGMRESKTTWADLLRDVKRRERVVRPKLAQGSDSGLRSRKRTSSNQPSRQCGIGPIARRDL
jgi:transposase-like protein